MEIVHRPLLNIKDIEKHYSLKDGLPVTYVCSTALDTSASSMDIFYRETPHPDFGNRYFGIYYGGYTEKNILYIIGADKVEDLEFDMIEVNGFLHYSKHRHDYNSLGSVAIDGGRAYMRLVGDNLKSIQRYRMKVKDGEFVEIMNG